MPIMALRTTGGDNTFIPQCAGAFPWVTEAPYGVTCINPYPACTTQGRQGPGGWVAWMPCAQTMLTEKSAPSQVAEADQWKVKTTTEPAGNFSTGRSTT